GVSNDVTRFGIDTTGHIGSFITNYGFGMLVEDYPLGIPVSDRFEFGGNPYRVLLEDADWQSTMTLGPNATVRLDGGPLWIEINPQSFITPLVGKTFDLFNWNGPLAPTNRFNSVRVPNGTTWDLSNLYTTGEVTLLSAVPEPSSLALGVMAIAGWCVVRRKRS